MRQHRVLYMERAAIVSEQPGMYLAMYMYVRTGMRHSPCLRDVHAKCEVHMASGIAPMPPSSVRGDQGHAAPSPRFYTWNAQLMLVNSPA